MHDTPGTSDYRPVMVGAMLSDIHVAGAVALRESTPAPCHMAGAVRRADVQRRNNENV